MMEQMDIFSTLITRALENGTLRLSRSVEGRIVLQASVGASWVTISEMSLSELPKEPARKKPVLEVVG